MTQETRQHPAHCPEIRGCETVTPSLSRRQVLALFGLGALSLPLISGCAVDPVTGRKTLVGMSRDQEISLDKSQSPHQFSNDYGEVRDRKLNGYITRVGRELSARSHRPDMPYSFRAVNAAYINAYAFPGGSIAATRGILTELGSEAELAALLGHEIGHVNARHAAERAFKGTLAGVLVAGAAIAAGAAGLGSNAAGLIQNLGGIGAGALLAHYSRDNEREADSLGMEYMTRAGYTPQGMVGLMEVLLKNGHRKPGAVELMFSTHPMSEERHATARQLADTRYASMLSAPDNRDRYMDNTAGLRRIKGAITAIQNGENALRKKKFGEAEEQLQRALKIAPNDYTALVVTAKSRLLRKKYAEAERYAMRAVGVYPEEAQAHIIAAVSSIETGRYEQALTQLSEYDRLLPGNPQILFFTGRAQEGRRRREEAARAYYGFLRQVRKGPQASYAYQRLVSWGYIGRPPRQ